jgi:hypothetical protein
MLHSCKHAHAAIPASIIKETFMKRLISIACLAFAVSPVFAADVGISISLGQPGFYGQLDIGSYPAPRLVYAEPRIVEQVVVVQQPVYLHVQAVQIQHWDQHCHEYQACNRPVYFVEDGWYNEVYVPEYQVKHNNGNGNKKHHKKNKHDR